MNNLPKRFTPKENKKVLDREEKRLRKVGKRNHSLGTLRNIKSTALNAVR